MWIFEGANIQTIAGGNWNYIFRQVGGGQLGLIFMQMYAKPWEWMRSLKKWIQINREEKVAGDWPQGSLTGEKEEVGPAQEFGKDWSVRWEENQGSVVLLGVLLLSRDPEEWGLWLDHGFAIGEYLRTLMSRISGRIVQTTDWNELSTEWEIRKRVTVNIDAFFSERYKRKQRHRAVELAQCFKGRVF